MYNRTKYKLIDPLYRPVYREELKRRFFGSRFIVVVCVNHIKSRPIERAVMYVIDLHDASLLMVSEDGAKYALMPMSSPSVIRRRDADGMPSTMEIVHKAVRELNQRYPQWRRYQGRIDADSGEVIDQSALKILPLKPPRLSEMATFLYEIGPMGVKLPLSGQDIEKSSRRDGKAAMDN